jgi:NAD-dependent dihydropyrimidine dehydrogenase PreA subunit
MSAPVAIGDCCTACGACLITCPASALVPGPRRPSLLETRCTGCLECLEVCPAGAVSLQGSNGAEILGARWGSTA